MLRSCWTLFICLWLLFSGALATQLSAERQSSVDISVDLSQTHEVSDKLYGIFFEEINHAGEGGLYAELIQDRSFDALAYTTGFAASQAETLELTPEVLRASAEPNPLQQAYEPKQGARLDSSALLKEQLRSNGANFINQPVAWRPLSSTKVMLTKTDPISANNLVALNVTTYNNPGGIVNSGYWGVPLNGGWVYHFSMYIKGDTDAKVQVLLTDSVTGNAYGEAVFEGIDSEWQKVSANITSNTTDSKGQVAILLQSPGSVLVDSLSLFPGGNMRAGWQNPYPFREDLLQLLKDLEPRFIRFPGGCYVEGGDWLRNRFPWKTSLGLNENRTGHLNDVWGYWSTDGLGLYEYMLLADELGAEPIYVVNNGVSHRESTQPGDLQPFIVEAMDALEFLAGPPNSTWGRERAAMGRDAPWQINYLAIGNEDCGRPYYVEDYNAFYAAIKAVYPDMVLIANCPMGAAAPTDLWDWHSYDASWTMFNRMHEFDNLRRGQDSPVFVSEYAVTADGGWGNLRAAVSEASFMTGMERNSDIIKLASYAPLFVHTENRIWPTNMIVIDNHRAYKTVSYLVQQLFSHFQGVIAAATSVKTTFGDVHQELVAASTTCQDAKCEKVAVKAVNFNSYEQQVSVSIGGKDISFEDAAVLHSVTGDHPEAENSFDDPEYIAISKQDVQLSGDTIGEAFSFQITLPPWSASVLEMTRKEQPSAAVAAATS